MNDLELLGEFIRQHSQDAFTALVHRHLNLVYCAALRQVRSPQLAEEVAQTVFNDLARSAVRLKSDTVLTAWLYEVTRRAAIDVVRGEARRQLREQVALEMNAINATADDWTHIEPFLDEAMHALDESDRAAVLLRFFENKSLREVGHALGTTDDTARKRINRAVEHLREYFGKRGVTIGASGLIVVISANAVQAAPVGLAATISTAALVGTSTATAIATKALVMTTLQKSIIGAALAVAIGVGVFEAREASKRQFQLTSLQREKSGLADQVVQLKAANERLSNQVAQTQESQALSKAQFTELLRLRGKSGVAQADAAEIAKLKSNLADQSVKADQMTNAMALGMEMLIQSKMTLAQARLDLMKKTRDLTEDQARVIRETMKQNIRKQAEIAVETISGKVTPEQRQALSAQARREEEEIKALLSPEQLAIYPRFQQAEKMAAAEKSANYEAGKIASSFDLSKEQQEQVRSSFYELYLNKSAGGLNQDAIAAARQSGNVAEIVSKNIELEKAQLDQKLRSLRNILTAEQLNTYREQQMKQIEMTARMLKTVIPKNAVGMAN